MSQTHPQTGDAETLDRIRLGDEATFLQIYRRLHPGIYRFALQMSGSSQTADDIVQDVFLALIAHNSGFDPARGSLSAYLYGIARKLLLRHLERSRDATVLGGQEGDDGPVLVSPAADALADLTRQESIEAVRRAVLSLPVGYREAVVLCDLEELDYRAAADVLGCAVGTVRSRLHRGRALLLEKLSRDRSSDPLPGGLRPARCLI